ncbi:MAG TPA: hypothetical protein VG965_04470 [Patescibacteria group bacterium]|nr:hypothetical protein [Patescibacteria group bacterium]
MDSLLVRQKLERAFNVLIKNDFFLLMINVNERTLTHRFALYLENEFPEYNVDCEYNRDGIGRDPKRIGILDQLGDVKADDSNGKTVYPDIIIHKRGTPIGIAVIEAKKSNTDDGLDREKLNHYKNELGYENAFFVKFPISENANSEDLYEKFKTHNFIEEI